MIDSEDRTASAGTDFDSGPGSVTIPAGQVDEVLAVPILSFQGCKSERSFRVRVTATRVVPGKESATARIAITPNCEITIRPGTANLDPGSGTSFTVERGGDVSGPYDLAYQVTAGPGTAPSDFRVVGATNPLRLVEGETSRIISIEAAATAEECRTARSFVLTVTAPSMNVTGKSATGTISAVTKGCQGPQAAFTFTPARPRPGQAVSFSDASTGSPSRWSWSFGDGGTASSQNTAHVFAKAGSFPVTLTVENSNGSNSSSQFVVVAESAAVLGPPGALTVTHYAGGSGGVGSEDGQGSAARFSYPVGIARDGDGNLYVADWYSQTVRKISPSGKVTTLAGAAWQRGSADGTGSLARFSGPGGVAVDSSGTIYVADTSNHTIRKIAKDGTVTTFAGSSGQTGSIDGTGSAARFYSPRGLAVDPDGTLYVSDSSNHVIRRVTATGVVSTLAGQPGSFGSTDGTGNVARFRYPYSICWTSTGLYVADRTNQLIRKVTTAGVVTTIAGTALRQGFADGTGASALFRYPHSVASDSGSNVYVVDNNNHAVRMITPSGVVTTIAGAGPGTGAIPGSDDGPGSTARFNYPAGIVVSPSGDVFVADSWNKSIRKISSAGTVTTLAGLGESGSADGASTNARFNGPTGVATDPAGNVYVADYENHTIRKITPSGQVATIAGKAAVPGYADGAGTNSRFYWPSDVIADTGGNVFVADGDGFFRKIASSGAVATISSPGVEAYPFGVGISGAGTVYGADFNQHRLATFGPSGVVTVLGAADGKSGFVDGPLSGARFNMPMDVAVDQNGNLYVADTGNSAIRKVTQAGNVTTLAGGSRGTADGTGSAAQFSTPASLVVDPDGNVFVADTGNHTIRKITPSGVVTTVLGLAGVMGSTDGTGPAGRLAFPYGLALDGSRRLYIADYLNHSIRVASQQHLMLSQGRVSVTVDWRSQYSGESGIAFALPQKDDFGFFYFADPNNPEVFVKVLDFSDGRARCFVGGLSDYYYKVTFTTMATGQTIVFEKPPGQLIGLADSSLAYRQPTNGSQPAAFDLGSSPEEEPAVLAGPFDLLLSRGRISVSVSWRNQYSGQTGTAFALPQQDEFGFFYFSSSSNPEVFVKALDFGSSSPFLVFYAGLTDFEYTVTFRNVVSGQAVSFTKRAGNYDGGADKSLQYSPPSGSVSGERREW